MNIKKEFVLRTLLGAPIGLIISTFLSIFISLGIGDGNYYAVVPELIERTGNELNAMVIQTVAVLIYGAVWGGLSVVWKIEKWSLLRQTVTHALIAIIVTFPMAYFMYWADHSVIGIALYMLTFIFIYAVIWATLYLITKHNIKKCNNAVTKIC